MVVIDLAGRGGEAIGELVSVCVVSSLAGHNVTGTPTFEGRELHGSLRMFGFMTAAVVRGTAFILGGHDSLGEGSCGTGGEFTDTQQSDGEVKHRLFPFIFGFGNLDGIPRRSDLVFRSGFCLIVSFVPA